MLERAGRDDEAAIHIQGRKDELAPNAWTNEKPQWKSREINQMEILKPKNIWN